MTSPAIDLALAGVGTQLKDRMLAVPIYQRPYAWEEEHITEYWTDVFNAFSKKPAEYFLGTIVLSKQGADGRDTVIDGQQRLATTLMLLAAVRDEFASRGDAKRAKIIQDRYISADDQDSAQLVSRLRLSSDDDPFFFKAIIEPRDEAIARVVFDDVWADRDSVQ